MKHLRCCFLSDTHLGLDSPANPRIHRRRRGDDFYGNFLGVLETARQEKVDFIVHGGDLFYRSQIKSNLVLKAFEPLLETAESGIPVIIVPGNHERSRIPYRLLTGHPNIHIFDTPATFFLNVQGVRIALAGFPFVPGDIRSRYRDFVQMTGWRNQPSDVRFLVIHQAVDGATVGPVNFMFRYREDVVEPGQTPDEFHGVLCGHIHRHQVITRDLSGARLTVPVYMAGSIDRTAFAERFEDKGVIYFDICESAVGEWEVIADFRKIRTRPMIVHDMHIDDIPGGQVEKMLVETIKKFPADAILRLIIHISDPGDVPATLTAARFRELAPDTMNVSAVWKHSLETRSYDE